MSRVDTLFIHGGPGLNSNPERMVLPRALSIKGVSYQFWDEPSLLRPQGPPFKADGAYKNWLDAIHRAVEEYQPRILVGGSFGGRACVDYLKLHSPKLDFKLLFVSPTLDMQRLLLQMMKISAADFSKTDDEKSKRLKALIGASHSFWDTSMQDGITLAWENPSLAPHYFFNKEVLAEWVNAYSDPTYRIDLEAQDTVFRDYKTRKFPNLGKQSKRPVMVLYGDYDPVFDLNETQAILGEEFDQVEFRQFQSAGHFPHLEHPKKFTDLILEWLPTKL